MRPFHQSAIRFPSTPPWARCRRRGAAVATEPNMPVPAVVITPLVTFRTRDCAAITGSRPVHRHAIGIPQLCRRRGAPLPLNPTVPVPATVVIPRRSGHLMRELFMSATYRFPVPSTATPLSVARFRAGPPSPSHPPATVVMTPVAAATTLGCAGCRGPRCINPSPRPPPHHGRPAAPVATLPSRRSPTSRSPFRDHRRRRRPDT